MIKIFIDSDIFLDVLLKRKNVNCAAELMEKIIRKKVRGYTSPLVIANLHYIMTKLENKNKSIENIKKIRKFISILTINEEIIDDALSINATDFEDAIQFKTAEKNEINFIITRNKKDYRKSKLPVMDAEEFLKLNH